MIAIAPTISPPAPRPWMARNPISWSMFWDSPASTEPIRKRTIADMNMPLRPYRSPSFPQIGVAAAVASA
jgi:hypothetical protein